MFKKVNGEAPVAFWNRARADRAASLLRETDLSLNEIAEMLGYCDVYHFSKSFKEIHARPPGLWRADSNSKCEKRER